MAQVEPSASGGEVAPDDSYMKMPPPVSGISYPTVGLADVRSNYLDGGLAFTGSYVDNVLAGQLSNPVSGEIYTVQPLVSLNKTTPRLDLLLSYHVGFTFYEPIDQLNYIDQSANFRYQYRLSPRMTVFAQDTFAQSSNAYSSPFTVGGTPTSGTTDIITPFGNRLINDAGGGIGYQFALNGMVGGSVESSVLHYPDLSELPGLSNSKSIAASGFYSRRVSPASYLGAIALYRHITTSPTDTTIDTSTPSLFYTVYIHRYFSVSAVVGGEYYQTKGAALPSLHAWTPSASISTGWQGRHGAAALEYSRDVTGGNGLLGSFTQQTAEATVNWQFNRAWSAQAITTYTNSKNESNVVYASGTGGHSIYGTASLARNFRSGLRVEAGYNRIHSQYSSVSAISRNPDSNRGYISIAYYFAKPLGR